MEENRLAPPIQVMMEAIVPKELSMTKSAKGAGFGEVTRLQRLFGSLEIWTISPITRTTPCSIRGMMFHIIGIEPSVTFMAKVTLG